jgi:plasmid stabilization system protein ParE
MKVILSKAAEADLESIADWIATDNPRRALTFTREPREACRSLAHAPLRYPFLARYERSGIRRRPHGNYLIFYRVMGETVEIVHIIHGARDYEAILPPPE